MSSSDYPDSRFYGAHSNNYGQANRPGSNPINRIIVHVVQGSWSSAINYFQDPDAYVSAHYTVRRDGFIGQSVHEEDIAYHAGNYSYNETSIGIEHEGYVSNPDYWFTDAMYDSSARLSAYLCDKYNIPTDRDHIIGHNEVPGATHTDPGNGWDWRKYMNLVKEYAGGSTDSEKYIQVVQNSSDGWFYASSNWGTSSYSSQRSGPNYRYITPKEVSDSSAFRISRPRSGTYAVYGWWPANSGYNNSTPIGIRTNSGFKWVRVDQRYNGGKWNHLGDFYFPAGDDYRIVVSRWTSGRGYVIADAVAIVER